MKLRPLDDRIVVVVADLPSHSKGGIALPDSAKEKPTRGEVIAIGPGRRMDDGIRAPLAVGIGDEVLFGRYSGQEVEIDDVEYRVISESDVLGTLERA